MIAWSWVHSSRCAPRLRMVVRSAATSGAGSLVMKVLADISIVPLGVGVSLSKYVAVCERVLREAGLNPQLHAFGTNVEGEWDAVVGAVRRCHQAVHDMGAPRVSTSVKLMTRVDREQTLTDKVRSVERQM